MLASASFDGAKARARGINTGLEAGESMFLETALRSVWHAPGYSGGR
jgi:hypothetical protein